MTCLDIVQTHVSNSLDIQIGKEIEIEQMDEEEEHEEQIVDNKE